MRVKDITELQDFMFDTMFLPMMVLIGTVIVSQVSATDEVIDFVLDAHDAILR